MRRILPFLLAAALVLPACTNGGEADRHNAVDSVVPYFVDRTAEFPGIAAHPLARVPVPRLRGIDGPTAISTADGRIVYTTFEEKVPLDPLRTAESQGVGEGTVLGRTSVRVSGTSGDQLLVDGAFSPAASATGRVAVGLLDDPDERYGHRYSAAVAVLEPGSTTPSRWTTSGGLRTPVAWVGESLLYAVPGEVGLPELRVTTGPGKDWQLAPRASFVAASPDGQRILIAVEEPGRGELLALEARSTKDGSPIARATPELRWAGLGSWSATGIVVVGAPEPGALAALELDESLQLRRKVDFDVPAELASPPNEIAVAPDHHAFGVATFVAGTRAPNVSWVILSCPLTADRCSRNDLRPGVANVGFVSNPSV